ncbi:MAG: hypothetical protein LAN59_09000 [Acidobacteriia bacterium]|nr:hypothetical protein [Terriglobia bacterium]
MPGLRIVALPAEQYYKARPSLSEMQPLAAGAFPQIVDHLLRPLTAEEAAPRQIQREPQREAIRVAGADYNDAAEQLNQLFLENLWADGLPVVPPTERAVKWMLSGTTRAPGEIIGQVAPKGGTATVEKIAINAVMAGARPEHLPVILAAMEGFTDPNFDLTHMQASTGSFTPVVIVNGPIAQELKFNSGIGLLGHGWRANSTVGRALRLCLLNLGQTWPAINDMSLTGRLESYTFYTFAENQEASPWEPCHVSLGFRPEDSTVTVATTGNPMMFGGGAVTAWSGQGILDSMVARISSVGFSWFHSQTYILVLHPDCAVELAKLGYTRKSLQEWLYEHARIPYEMLASATVGFSHAAVIDFTRQTIADGRIRPEHAATFREALKPGGRIPAVQGPEDFHIFVAGGSPGYDLLFSYPGPNQAHQTKRIAGATLTHAGR